MARNDGIDRTSARNVNLTAAKIGNAQRHNEREKESYTNPDIIPERTPQNIHFKKPTAGYAEMFAQMEKDGVISTRGLKTDAVPFSSKVMLDRSEYENLAAAVKKLYVQERKESKLQKALDAAMKMISELKAKVASLTAELAEYKSVRSQLNTAGLEQQNELLRNKLHRYETVIERNGLWNLFRPSTRTKDITRQEERL